jgi:hypothetical protein
MTSIQVSLCIWYGGASVENLVQQEFTGTLTDRDLKTHVAHGLALTHGAASVTVRLEHLRGPGLGHMLCLSIFDCGGFRGSGHRDGVVSGSDVVHEVAISNAVATPGYYPGSVPAGALRVVIHAHRIIAGETCPYRLSVEWNEGPVSEPRTVRTASVARPIPPQAASKSAWYRGDLHAHTVHSDGDWDIPAFLGEARKVRLDFVALTEHNTTSHLAAIGELSEPEPLIIAGMELTTFRGHALSLGTREWIDWGVMRNDGMSGIAGDVRRQGGLFVIAHPRAEGDPVCTGCDWRFEEMMPGQASAVEVWNGPWAGDSNNEPALALWHEWLNQGRRLVATAGSDAHGAGGLRAGVGSNVVWSEGLTEQAILGSIAAGRLYLSCGPHLEIAAAAAGREAGMGGTLSADSADIQAVWRRCPAGSLLLLVADGVVVAGGRVEGDGTRRWDSVKARWCAVELRDRNGEMLALTNPVYLDPAGMQP